jgi:3-deoxy-manno-octulosonate cytidylyltransferase (CMP-KDO synthetase)
MNLNKILRHKTAIIPSRLASTRLPNKALIDIEGKSLIQRVYEAVFSTQLFDRVIIATDHDDIYKHAKSFDAEVLMTSVSHQSGTDRVEECARGIETDLIVNIQGDEPFITKEPLEKLVDAFNDSDVQIASLMNVFENTDDVNNPNNVKVITDMKGDAIYFSRSVIPFNRDLSTDVIYYRHIGVYAFRPEALKMFVSLPVSNLEQIERLEQLRLIENRYKIKMVMTEYQGIGIDTPEDLEKARHISPPFLKWG